MSYVVYKVYSDLTDLVYYGYCSEDINIKEQFTKQTKPRSDGTVRGASSWFESIDYRLDAIMVKIEDTCIDHQEAWCVRNDLRCGDVASITGPCFWPGEFNEEVKKTEPQRASIWKRNARLSKCITARQAYQLKAFSFTDIKNLAATHTRDVIMADLDKLTPLKFCIKYNMAIQYDTISIE